MEKFEQFINERIYLKNASPHTVEWYREAFKGLSQFLLTEDGLKEFVISIRQSGLKPISCNGRIRVANAFLKWLGSPLKLSRLKEEEKIPATFQPNDVARLLAWKPNTAAGRRLHTLVCTLLDTGVRIDEALSLRMADVDLDNLLLTVHGKGNKQRKYQHRLSFGRYSGDTRRAMVSSGCLAVGTTQSSGAGMCCAI